jgi:hypothetical protein
MPESPVRSRSQVRKRVGSRVCEALNTYNNHSGLPFNFEFLRGQPFGANELGGQDLTHLSDGVLNASASSDLKRGAVGNENSGPVHHALMAI